VQIRQSVGVQSHLVAGKRRDYPQITQISQIKKSWSGLFSGELAELSFVILMVIK